MEAPAPRTDLRTAVRPAGTVTGSVADSVADSATGSVADSVAGCPVAAVAVVVMAKAPIQGRVKTRMCPPCSPVQAADVAMACLLDTFDAVRAGDARRLVLALEGDPGPWVPEDFEVVPQVSGDLSVRLGAAIGSVGGPLLVVGMDTPQLTPDALREAARVLCSPGVDAVLGPAHDGGYWMIGLRRPEPGCVVGVPMSRPDTGALQLQRLVGMGMRVEQVAALRDVDTFEDAVAVARSHPGLRLGAVLDRCGLLER